MGHKTYESYVFTFGGLLQWFILKGDSTFSRAGVTLTFLWSQTNINSMFKNIQYVLL